MIINKVSIFLRNIAIFGGISYHLETLATFKSNIISDETYNELPPYV